MEKPKIIFAGDLGSDVRTGGGHLFARDFFSILSELNIELYAFTLWVKDLDKGVLPEGIEPIFVSGYPMSRPIAGIEFARGISKKIKNNPDLIILDQPSLWPYLLPNAPILAMFHGSDFVHLKDLSIFHLRSSLYKLLWEKPFLNRLQKNLLFKKNGTPLFNSKSTLNLVSRDFGVSENSLSDYVTYLPVNVENFKSNEISRKEIRQKFGIADEDIVIMYLSNFSPIKHAEKVPPIVKRLAEKVQGKQIKFMFIGRGIASAPLDELAEDSKWKNICTRVGEIPQEKVADFWSAADIAISTSGHESFGYFIAQGMSAGLPFVAYPGGAIQEIISNGETGFIADTENEFVAALEKLVSDKTLRTVMGKKARERIMNNFSIKGFKSKLINLLEQDFGMKELF
jgi:glycosyltransferase involved in cell wall biosynthesis